MRHPASMGTHERFLGLIRHVYDAASDEARWPVVLERLSDEYRGAVAGLQYRAGAEGRVTSAQFVRLDPALLHALRTHYAARNPWVRATQPLLRPGVVVATDHVVPIPELRKTSFHDGILKPAGVLHGFGACVMARGHDVLSFTVVRPTSGGPFGPAELARVRDVLPHLRRAVQVNEQLAEWQRTCEALGDGLDRLRNGVVIVSASGSVIFANRAARSMAAQRDGLAITATGVEALRRDERLAVRSLIAAAIRSSRGETAHAGGSIGVSRPSAKRPFFLMVAPLRLALDDDAAPGLATIFITDPESRPESSWDVCRRVYGLTAAEARICHALVASGSVKVAAEQLGIASETARWHLKRIYRKTGTGRQAALVRRLIIASQAAPSNPALDLSPSARNGSR